MPFVSSKYRRLLTSRKSHHNTLVSTGKSRKAMLLLSSCTTTAFVRVRSCSHRHQHHGPLFHWHVRLYTTYVFMKIFSTFGYFRRVKNKWIFLKRTKHIVYIVYSCHLPKFDCYPSKCYQYFYIFYFPHTVTFQLLDKPWSQDLVSPFLPPGSCLQSLSRTGFSNPNARRFFVECC